MRKIRQIFAALLCIAFVITLSGCGQSEEAKAMDAQILEIGEVSLDSVEAIEAAENAYSALDEQDQKQVKKYKELVEARNTYSELRAAEVVEAINKIGLVDTSSLVRKRIQQAEKRFLSLTEAEQALVTNAALLEQAKADYDAACAKEVEQQIEQVGMDMSKIKKTEAAYKELTPSQRDLVKNYSKLTDAKISYVIKSIEAIEAIGEVTLDNSEEINSAYKVYYDLSADEKKQVTNASILQQAKDQIIELQRKLEEIKNAPPIKLKGYALGKNSIGDPTLRVNATNISDKTIKEYSLMVFAYDNDGIPVKVYFNNFSTGLKDTDALKPGASTKSNSYWQLYGEYNEMKQFVILLNAVEFYDGTTWENPKYSAMYNKYYEKILASGDENILPRA